MKKIKIKIKSVLGPDGYLLPPPDRPDLVKKIKNERYDYREHDKKPSR